MHPIPAGHAPSASTLSRAINVALGHHLMRHIYPLRITAPRLRFHLQHIYLRYTRQNQQYVINLRRESDEARQRFLAKILIARPQELTAHLALLHLQLSEVPFSQRHITVLVRDGDKLVEFDFFFLGEIKCQ